MATLSTLIIKRLRNVITAVQQELPAVGDADPVVTGRVFGAPTFLQSLMDKEFNIELPSIFVIDERDSADPLVGGQVSYQDIRTEIDIAVALSRMNKEQIGKDLEYLDNLSAIKDQIFSALLNWGYHPTNALDIDEDGNLENVNDHGPFVAEYVGSDNTLTRNGYLFHIFTFRFKYMIEGGAPISETYTDFLHFFGDVNEGEESFEVVED